ncbi:MAG: Phage SPO1 DNA polymerase-related protein [Microgenomates group bacterium GW2011_GWA2_39_19]|nr:MAG: Phage SPO1 DNA polymerase-related protein [Microgenomates group bacterium GW2011_GWA2_39_19]
MSINKREELEKLKKEMQGDNSLPLRAGATQLVFGEGNPNTKVYFIGEGPGFNEDRLGRPFVGQAGKLLDNLLQSVNLKREDVYISNIVRFRPPENRDPLPEEIEAFRPYVDREIEIIDPKIIVTLGRFSMGKFLPNVKISQVHGKPRKISWHGREMVIIPMYHPAAALRAGAIMQQIREDFKIIPEVIKGLEEENKKEDNSGEQMKLL